MRWFFGFFFISGFCSILYELVWLRLAMAQFGVTTALVSIVLSMFMAGLGLGSWGSGYLIRKHGGQINFPALRLYALTELAIGLSAILVPRELLWGRNLLGSLPLTSSFAYYVACGIWIALALVPWCACMGATIPVAMLAIRDNFRQESQRSFSFLYLANVLGAVVGAIVPLFLIELFGFHGTLKVGAALNVLLAVSAFSLTLRHATASAKVSAGRRPAPVVTTRQPLASRRPLVLLLATGLTSMAIEVVWIRQFTPYLGTVVYAFALILSVYLASTFVGSRVYRRWSRTHQWEGSLIWVLLGFSILLPLITADPQVHVGSLPVGEWFAKLVHGLSQHGSSQQGSYQTATPYVHKGLYSFVRLLLGIAPFSAILGFVTPMLVDRWSGGDPDYAGRAYAVNVVGCILGPLLSGFVLLPLMNERWVLFLFSVPWLAIGIVPRWSSGPHPAERRIGWQNKLVYACALLALILAFTSKGYEDLFANRVVLRDNTATIIATGAGMQKHLFVNGVGITSLTPITKIMAHLSLASLDHPPHSALVVCFGMGTTYRSLLSWGIQTTAVELVPSVPRVFWYYHADGPELLRSPLSHVVIDDGRRYLERTPEQYDVINIDPPPPVQAAGSSLLYSKEFYSTAKRRLRSGGILQQWMPVTYNKRDDIMVRASVARALAESFAYVRVFHSTESPGLLFLATSYPMRIQTAEELVQRMPSAAIRDLIEWGPESTAERELSDILDNELPIAQVISAAPQAAALQDDRPVNEYYALRRFRMSGPWQRLMAWFGLTPRAAQAQSYPR